MICMMARPSSVPGVQGPSFRTTIPDGRSPLATSPAAGGQYVLHDVTWKTDTTDYTTDILPSATTDGITTVVRTAAGLAQTVTVVPSALQCYCPAALTTEVDCIGHENYVPCADDAGTASQDESGIPGHYLTITASATFNPFLPSVPWFSAGMTVVERLVLRIN